MSVYAQKLRPETRQKLAISPNLIAIEYREKQY